MKYRVLLLLLPLLTACDDYTPSEKRAVYDKQTGTIIYPHPCPDWSHNSVLNNDNSLHSNFGCATQTNMAVQIEDPADLDHGHGTSSPDAEINARVIERYRAGEIPAELVPQQATSSQ